MALNPIDHPDAFDSLEVGTVRSPGKVEFSGHDRKANWDVKTGKGIDGGTTTLNGIPAIEVSATFTLVNVEEFEAWVAFAKAVKSTISATPKGVDVYHPDLAENDIKSVCMATFGGRVHDGKGGQKYTIKFQEYRAPKKKPAASITASGSGKPASLDPNAAALAKLEALTKKYQETPWG